jgi:type IV pilus assembly protein PilV
MVKQRQGGFLIIEALVAILIFSLGILGLIAMGSSAIGAQSDSRARTDAAALADEIASRIAVTAARSVGPVSGIDPVLVASLGTFDHRSTGIATAAVCAFTGNASLNPVVTAWVADVTGGARRLPGATPARQQIRVDTSAGAYNRIDITICWQGPNDQGPRRHTLVTYVN